MPDDTRPVNVSTLREKFLQASRPNLPQTGETYTITKDALLHLLGCQARVMGEHDLHGDVVRHRVTQLLRDNGVAASVLEAVVAEIDRLYYPPVEPVKPGESDPRD